MNVYSHQFNTDSGMPEGEKILGEPVVMKWAKSDPLFRIRFSDLSKIGGATTPFPASLRLIPGTTNFSFEFHKKQVYEEIKEEKRARELVETLYKNRK